MYCYAGGVVWHTDLSTCNVKNCIHASGMVLGVAMLVCREKNITYATMRLMFVVFS